MLIKYLIIAVAIAFLPRMSIAGPDTNAPVAISANCFDGRTIGLHFNEEVDPVSAAVFANYEIWPPNVRGNITGKADYAVSSVEVRPDRKSLLLKLDRVYPGHYFRLRINKVEDLSGNSRSTVATCGVDNFELNNVGDANETAAIFSADFRTYELTAGGRGLGGTNDSFTFLAQPWRSSSLYMEARVISLEPVNRFSSAGLMVREDLNPGARFFSVLLTPPAVPAQDGSGPGANRARVLYREQRNGDVVEIPIPQTLSTNTRLEIGRGDNVFRAVVDSGPAVHVTFSQGFADASLIGMAVSSYNDSPGFSAEAVFSNYRLLVTDLPPQPVLSIRRNVDDLLISWTEPYNLEYALLESPEVTAEFWYAVTNRTIKVQRDTLHWEATTTVPIKPGREFYSLIFSRQ